MHLTCDGLRASGEMQLVRELARRFFDTVQRGGFAEKFDAVTGRSLRDPSYTWTSSVFLVSRTSTSMRPHPGPPPRQRS